MTDGAVPIMEDIASDSDAKDMFQRAAPVGAEPISTRELLEMFKEAAPKGPCPDEAMITQCDFITSNWWLEGLASFDHETRKENARKVAERPNREQKIAMALDTLLLHLPQLIEINTVLVEAIPDLYDPATVIDLPTRLYQIAAEAKAGLGMRRIVRKPQQTLWHSAAKTIASDAIKAWRLAGRTKFSTKPTSPIVNFTHLFFARVGYHQDHGAIAKAFERGAIGKRPKSAPTT